MRAERRVGSGRGIGVALALVAVMVTSVLVGTAAPAAATTRTISGTVACQGGKPVQGIWVQSSAGGSRWADNWSARSGAPWLADYSVEISTNAASTSIRLDIGCGTNANGSWWSTNLTPSVTVSSSTQRSALCREAAGRAQRCSWWGSTVLVGMPFTGAWACPSGSTTKYCNDPPPSHPSQHHGSGNWTVDIYKDKAEVRPYLYARRGDTLKLTVSSYGMTCGTAGSTLNLNVILNGATIGTVGYHHLDAVPSGYRKTSNTVAVGGVIGKTRQWAKQGATCWSVTNPGGVHTHFAATNRSGYACFWDHAMTKTIPIRQLIGRVGAGGPSARQRVCP